ncbi:glycoside hydrolase family 113 [Streptomyces sp. NPDC015131]|uniref:glycoside hydrolase family 113 n=1 Tax=Streptomyces sp. NPDC015131 TaxID=3364941 RepID=UPI003700A1C9
MTGARTLLGRRPARYGPPPGHRGFALPAYAADGYDDPGAPALLRRIASVGGNWIQLNPTWYQTTWRSADVRPTPATPADGGLARMVYLAHRQGLKVLLKPHLDLDDESDRAAIRPDRPDDWFAAYTELVCYYARLAAWCGADAYAVGTELAGTSGDGERWRAVVGRARAAYPGPLLYAANYDEYEDVAFWDALDLAGVDAYWPLSDAPGGDVRRLVRAWRPVRDRLERFAAGTGKPVLFTEAGCTSVHGAATAPYSWTVSTTPDPGEQAAYYEALLRAFTGRPWWAGVHWWVWQQLPGTAARFRSLDYSVHGKEAEDVVARWWAPSAPRHRDEGDRREARQT